MRKSVSISSVLETRGDWRATREPIGLNHVLLVAGKGDLPSERALEAFVSAAGICGSVISPESAGFAELFAVRSDVASQFGDDIERWPEQILGTTWKDYMLSVQRSVKHSQPLFAEMYAARINATEYPKNFIFELANVCNLSCPVCPRNHRAIQDGLMDIRTAKAVVDDIASTNKKITFYPHYLGETLIHPDLLTLLDHALKHDNLSINIISNAVLLDDQISRELLSRPLKNFHFSLHECDTALQKGVASEEALSAANVLRFLQLAEELGKRDQIWIETSMIPDQLDEPAVEAFREFWQPLMNSINIYSAISSDRQYLDRNTNEAFRDVYLPCPAPWEQPVIAVDGSVLPCCWDYEHKMVLGNIFQQRFGEINKGEHMLKLKRALLDQELSNYPTCFSCKQWLLHLPYFRAVDMCEYNLQSNGTALSFQTKKLESALIEERVSRMRIVGSGRQNLPLHRGGRPQARRTGRIGLRDRFRVN